ncbi:uncharacterized protein VP01_3438g2 [Puccinia sorghi]|uniref:Uncharacterized protein n=1 Tax=Puccinia sorghi TaxID=27349 RepID=A0A0L6UWD2_9BASI|nr:uncharacterized protein VP01_3438g2 [Puccinia sorghi]
MTARQNFLKTAISKKKIKILEKNVTTSFKEGSAFVGANKMQEKSNSIQKVEADLKAKQLIMAIMKKDLGSLTNNLVRQ